MIRSCVGRISTCTGRNRGGRGTEEGRGEKREEGRGKREEERGRACSPNAPVEHRTFNIERPTSNIEWEKMKKQQ
jgi:hypothetical protein